MTSAEMLSKVRTLLDESAAGFWSDDEIYSALSAGQRSVTDAILSHWKKVQGELPNAIRTLTAIASETGMLESSVRLPDNFLYPISVLYNHKGESRMPVFIRDFDKETYFMKDNVYLASYPGQYYCNFTDDLNFETPVVQGSGTYLMYYLKIPADIDTGTNPVLPDFTHDTIIQYAYSELLKKDDKAAEANSEYKIYVEKLKELYI